MWIKVLFFIFSLPLPLPPSLSHSLFFLFNEFFHQAKELDANTEYYIELLAKGTGKPKEEIAKEIQRPKYLKPQEAIDYGLADKIIESSDDAFEKRVILSIHLTFVFCYISCTLAHFNNEPSIFRIMMLCLLNQKP